MSVLKGLNNIIKNKVRNLNVVPNAIDKVTIYLINQNTP